MIGGGRASTLSDSLRYEEGLVYSAHALTQLNTDSGAFFVKTSPDNKDFSKVFDIIAAQFDDIRNGEIEPELVDFVKKKSIKNLKFKSDSTPFWVNNHYFQELISPKSKNTVVDIVNKVQDISIEDIQKTAQKYFDLNKLYLGLCGNVDLKKVNINGNQHVFPELKAA
jgi:predicted Zn-dependent peptidase